MAQQGPECSACSAKIFSDLALLTRGPALRLVRSAERGNGLHAWRLFGRRYEGTGGLRLTGLLNHILYFNWKGKDWLDKYMQWKSLLNEYETALGGDTELPKQVKIAAVVEGSRHAAAELRSQLQSMQSLAAAELGAH